MSADSTILAGRQFNESLMESTCVITRTTGFPTTNADGSTTPATAQVYSGPCRLRFPALRPSGSLVQGQEIADGKGILSVPVVGTNGIRANDVAVITVGALDPGTTVTVRVEAPFQQTHATARRFPVQVLA